MFRRGLVDDGCALLSMRSSDFDAYKRHREVIDNSIQAGAKNIRLLVKFQPSGRNRSPQSPLR